MKSLPDTCGARGGWGEDMGKWLLGKQGTQSIAMGRVPVSSPFSKNSTITRNFLDLIKNGPYKIAAHQIGYYIHNLFLFCLSRHFPTVSYQFFYWYGYIIFLRAASVCQSYVCLWAFTLINHLSCLNSLVLVHQMIHFYFTKNKKHRCVCL